MQNQTKDDESEWTSQYCIVIDSCAACEENGDQNNGADNNQ